MATCASREVRISVRPLTRMPHIISPEVCSSRSPAWLIAVGVQSVLSSLSHHLTRRGLLPAPRAKIKRSSVTTIAPLPTGAFVIAAAGVPVFNCHSYILPSFDEQAIKY